jgi:hypothetical protein
MVAGQLAPAHPRAIVGDGERRQGGIGPELKRGRARIEGVGHDLGHDRLLERPGIGVPDVLEEMLQIDACLAHVYQIVRRRGLSCRSPSRVTRGRP